MGKEGLPTFTVFMASIKLGYFCCHRGQRQYTGGRTEISYYHIIKVRNYREAPSKAINDRKRLWRRKRDYLTRFIFCQKKTYCIQKKYILRIYAQMASPYFALPELSFKNKIQFFRYWFYTKNPSVSNPKAAILSNKTF
jgi:hypothetical protein